MVQEGFTAGQSYDFGPFVFRLGEELSDKRYAGDPALSAIGLYGRTEEEKGLYPLAPNTRAVDILLLETKYY